MQLLTGVPLYDMQVFHAQDRLIVHAPGSISPTVSTPKSVSFKVKPWTKSQYDVLIVGLKTEPKISLNGSAYKLIAPSRYDAPKGRLILHLQGEISVKLDL